LSRQNEIKGNPYRARRPATCLWANHRRRRRAGTRSRVDYVLWHLVLSSGNHTPAVSATLSHALTIFHIFPNKDGAGSLGTVRITSSAVMGRIVTVASNKIDIVYRETADRPAVRNSWGPMITNGPNAVMVFSNPMNVTLWTIMNESGNWSCVCRPGQEMLSIVRVKRTNDWRRANAFATRHTDAPFGRQ
jgi:hypothetical protein